MQEVTAEILIERVWVYCEKILSGEIKACQKHKWAVQRFFKDVEALADPEKGLSCNGRLHPARPH